MPNFLQNNPEQAYLSPLSAPAAQDLLATAPADTAADPAGLSRGHHANPRLAKNQRVATQTLKVAILLLQDFSPGPCPTSPPVLPACQTRR